MHYDLLSAQLRRCAEGRCIGCPRIHAEGCRSSVSTEAADAIESLLEISKRYYDLLEKMPRWMPVTERLPDATKDEYAYSGRSAEIAPSDDVLCYLGSEKRQTVAWYSHTYKEWTTVDENTVYKYGEVTHWMPLPSAPMMEVRPVLSRAAEGGNVMGLEPIWPEQRIGGDENAL